MQILRKARFGLALAVVVLFYLLGIVTRQHFGVRVEVRNRSGHALRHVTVKLERDKEYSLGEIAVGNRKAIYVEPAGGDSIRLEAVDSSNVKHTDVIAGYVESGYCGDVSVEITPDGRVIAADHSFAPYSWKSWWAFIV